MNSDFPSDFIPFLVIIGAHPNIRGGGGERDLRTIIPPTPLHPTRWFEVVLGLFCAGIRPNLTEIGHLIFSKFDTGRY